MAHGREVGGYTAGSVCDPTPVPEPSKGSIGTLMPTSYYVAATWDADAGVWISDSNIPGLHVESETLGEFEALAMALAPEMLAENVGIHDARILIDFRAQGAREPGVDAKVFQD
eukprot:gene56523-77460_t